jgi:hypothetical protein
MLNITVIAEAGAVGPGAAMCYGSDSGSPKIMRLRLRILGFTYYHCGSGSNKMIRLRFRNTAFTSCCVKLVKILENSMNIISGIGAGVAMY